jgi:hypothetical protein
VGRKIPAVMKVGAAFLGGYAAVLALQFAQVVFVAPSLGARAFIGAAVRSGTMVLLAVCVVKGARWAWYLAVAGSAVLLGLHAVAVPVLPEAVIAALRRPTSVFGVSTGLLVASIGSLLGALLCLLAPASRRAMFTSGS